MYNFIGDIEYLKNKLRLASYLPKDDNIREFIRFNKFKDRMKINFLEIIRKPLRLQADKLGLNSDNVTIDI